MSGSSSLVRLLSAAAVTATLVAACSSTSTTPAAPSAASSAAPSVEASASAEASPSASAEASPSEAASPSASAEAASPAARTVQMYALDGSYLNAPVAPKPGTILTFRNLGSQAHELRVLRRNDNATAKQTFDDLSKVKPADLAKFTTVVGVLAADPNSQSTGQLVIDQPGDYAVVDFLPVGTTTAPASPDPSMAPGASTNYSKGMFTTFTAVPPAS